MAAYRASRPYRMRRTYAGGDIGISAPGYRKAQPYRKPRSYRGSEDASGVVAPRHVQGGGLGWSPGVPAGVVRSHRWGHAAVGGTLRSAPLGDHQGHGAQATAFPLETLDPAGVGTSLRFDAISPHGEAAAVRWTRPAPQSEAAALPWADFAGQHERLTSVRHQQLAAHGRTRALPWGQYAAHALSRSALWRRVVARGGLVALPWSPIAARSSGIHIDWPVEPDPGTGPIVVPSLPVYVMLPTLTCVRLPDRTPIRMLSISLESALGSWAWSFSAPIAHKDVALLNAPGGEPTQIEVTINGYVWTLLVDGYDDNRRFGSQSVTLRGRSRSALLAEPYAPVRTYTETADRTAAQLADAELTGSGWTLLWDAPDWLVPGGTFSYADLAPIDAIAQVANAIGASIQSDPEALQLTVAPTYPESPWAWDAATPWAILPAGILAAGDSSEGGGNNANGVYVYAQDSASAALVKLAGSDGALQLPMIVDKLTVHADAQRERGRNALAGAGRKRNVTRTVPLFPTPPPAGQPDLGPVVPGKLIELEDGFLGETWRGQVMAVRIDAQRAGSALSVRQHLTIERQYR